MAILEASNSKGLEPGLLDSLPNDPHFGRIFWPPFAIWPGRAREQGEHTPLLISQFFLF